MSGVLYLRKISRITGCLWSCDKSCSTADLGELKNSSTSLSLSSDSCGISESKNRYWNPPFVEFSESLKENLSTYENSYKVLIFT